MCDALKAGMEIPDDPELEAPQEKPVREDTPDKSPSQKANQMTPRVITSLKYLSLRRSLWETHGMKTLEDRVPKQNDTVAVQGRTGSGNRY